jgi:hypothetical protein
VPKEEGEVMPSEQETPTSQSMSHILESEFQNLVKVEAKRRKVVSEYKRLRSEMVAMQAELEAHRKRPPDPTLEQLRAELAEIKSRKIFDKLASEANVRPDALDNLWKTSGFKVDPSSDVINVDAVKALIAEQQKAQPYLFNPSKNGEESKTEEKMEPGPGNSRGGLVRDSGKFQVRRRGPGSVRDPEWMQANQQTFDEARKAGTLEWID